MKLIVKSVYTLANKDMDSQESYACRKIAEYIHDIVQNELKHKDVEITVGYNNKDYYFYVLIVLNNADNLVMFNIEKHLFIDMIYLYNYGLVTHYAHSMMME